MNPIMNSTHTEKNEISQFCTFRIAGRLFGLAVTDVKEIHPVVKFTPVFHAVEEIKGYVNIRGQVHLILDLRILLGFEGKETDAFSQIVLFKPHVGESFGILVDAIGDVIETDLDHMEGMEEMISNAPDSHLGHFSDLVKSICKLEKELLVILNSTDLFRRIEDKVKG